MKPEELKALKEKVKESLDVDRHTLVMKFPFIGGISLKMNLIPVRDEYCPTACTDGKNIYFDCAFYSDLSPKQRVFVLAHEIWHCVMLHLARRQTRDPMLFNIATDMEVNQLLKINSKDGILEPPKEVLMPPPGMEKKSAEDLYDWLLKQMKKMQKKGGAGQQGQQGNQSGKNSSSQSQSGKSQSGRGGKSGSSFDPNRSYADQAGDGDDGEDGNGGSGLSKQLKDALSGKSGQSSGKLEGQFDKHKYKDDPTLDDKKDSDGDGEGEDGDGEGDSASNGKSSSSKAGNGQHRKDKYGEVGRDDDFQPKVADDFAEEMRETVIAQAQQCQRQQGTLPAGIEDLLKKLDKPEFDWKEILARFVTTCYNGSRRWLPPNRRHVYNETYFQSRRTERLKVAVAIDTSGSCVGDLPKFFGELKGLLDSFGGYDLDLMCCDARVDSYEHYDENNPLELDKEVKWTGGGGTSFKPPFKFIEDHGLMPDCMLYLTDGYGDAPENPPDFPFLWVLTSDGSEDFCEWGQKLRFKERSSSYED